MTLSQTLSHLYPESGETVGFITASDVRDSFTQTYTDLASKEDLENVVIESGSVTPAYVDAGDAASRQYTDDAIEAFFIGDGVSGQVEVATFEDLVENVSESDLTLGSGFTDPGGVTAGLYATRNKNLATIEFKVRPTADLLLTSGQAFSLVSIPAGYRPAHLVQTNGWMALTGTPGPRKTVEIQISTSGTVMLYSYVSETITTSGFVSLYITYRAA